MNATIQTIRQDVILIIDDTPASIMILNGLLNPHYTVWAATSGTKALDILHQPEKPDLIILDVMMPEMDGLEVFRRLRNDVSTALIPIIFLTAMDSIDDELRGLELGAVDYITKPLVPPVLLARVRTQLELKHARDLLQNQNNWLEAEVQRRMQENNLIQQISIRALAHLAETRDPETGNHILRTQGYVNALATCLCRHPRFSEVLTPRYIDLLTVSAPLHDIGKVGIPDAILMKPGSLNSEEWAIMKTHAELGARAIQLAEEDAECEVEFLRLAKEIAHSHHERWDGNGYPQGLVGDDIPISARFMAIADVFDALISPRVYKPAMPYGKALEIIVDGKGKHFDPDIVDAFINHFGQFCTIADEHRELEETTL